MGRSRGGLTTKIHARCHGRERAVYLLLRALLIEGGIFPFPALNKTRRDKLSLVTLATFLDWTRSLVV